MKRRKRTRTSDRKPHPGVIYALWCLHSNAQKRMTRVVSHPVYSGSTTQARLRAKACLTTFVKTWTLDSLTGRTTRSIQSMRREKHNTFYRRQKLSLLTFHHLYIAEHHLSMHRK
ncbi:hypothetical protein CC86DRAFT_98003 [Ophiobolus disseminans]|uniref:Uncharacterized protein n=1 Tax=Ophiobolus disseminans TaxID=1469910 RepID=A0A6A6ZMJ7_9PLEO|nr:hypothetical protein CC86DRAFT_98003 [Ophiobolus disseminans]